MTGIITKRFRLFAAEQLKELFDEVAPENLYIFIGRTSPWVDDNNPPTPTDTVSNSEYSIWSNIISAKKVAAGDVTFAAVRNNWTSGTIYAKYTSDTEFQSGAFFVLTDEYNVYKCMDNNNGGHSTVKPTGRLTTVFTTGDGYRWKFMGEISAADAVKYVTTSYIPVKTLTADDGSFQWNVQAAAVNGAIDTAIVTSGGANYKQNTGTVVSSNTTKITVASSANSTNGVYVGSSIYITNGTGAGQKRSITGWNGASRLATVSPAFSVAPTGASTYIISPTVSISGDGVNFSAYSTVSNGSIKTVEVINRGQSYSRATLSITANTTSGGSGAAATAELAPSGGHGSNPVYELSGHNVMMYVQFSGTEGGKFFSNNDFRIVGVLANPRLANGSLATATSYLVSPQFVLTSPSGTFLPDEVITGATSGATANFVEYANSSCIIVTNQLGTFTTENISGGTSAATAHISSIVSSPFKSFSGSLLYVENRSPIVRSVNQEENFRLVITL
jgi:hypothetical protein